MDVLPGAEFSCMDPATGRKAHILCYGNVRVHRLEGFVKDRGKPAKVSQCFSAKGDALIPNYHGDGGAAGPWQ